MKIDIYNHVLPERYLARTMELAPRIADIGKRVRGVPALYDLDARLRMMDAFGDDYRQVLSLVAPPIETIAGPELSPELARIANDELAALVNRHPDRFAGFVAALPLNNMEATLAEIDRAIDQLGACGVQIFAHMCDRAYDAPAFAPLFDALAARDLPIWVHPARTAESLPDYPGEGPSKYEIWWTLGWPYETSVFMARMVFSGLFVRHPDIKIITHHLGGMIPYFEGRVGPGWDQLGSRTSDHDYGALLEELGERPIDALRRFYGDTALFGSFAGTVCGLAFFGADHVLFASDCPFDPEGGPMYIRETIAVIDRLDISDQERHMIYEGNARRLLKL